MKVRRSSSVPGVRAESQMSQPSLYSVGGAMSPSTFTFFTASLNQVQKSIKGGLLFPLTVNQFCPPSRFVNSTHFVKPSFSPVSRQQRNNVCNRISPSLDPT